MSNPCFTTYMVTGRRKDVETLHATLQRMQNDKTPLVENGWYEANMWLGCLVKALGGEPEEVTCLLMLESHYILAHATLTFLASLQ